ncbi:MAG: LysR family transcriptional regulator [Clostridiales bacterium]|nr:LysR family transcriptional regulator [Clostridiales bacterium]
MTLRHIKIFVAVCEYQSVTTAAEHLYLAQPSVSLAIRELEEYYGVKLFDRISRKLYLTSFGEEFLNYASHIISLFEEMETGMKNWDSVGVLRIGSSVTIGTYLMPQYVLEFQKKYPKMHLKIFVDNASMIEKMILANEIDFALTEGIVHSPHVAYKKFMDDELILLCSPNHPFSQKQKVSLSDLSDQDFILREKGSSTRELFDSVLLSHQMEIQPIWESINPQAIIKAVECGLGISILPYQLVKEELKNQQICRIWVEEISFKREYFIIHHKNKFLSKSAQAFMDLCRK